MIPLIILCAYFICGAVVLAILYKVSGGALPEDQADSVIAIVTLWPVFLILTLLCLLAYIIIEDPDVRKAEKQKKKRRKR